MVAIVAVMRKLLHSIYGMLKHDQDFNGQKFYPITASAAWLQRECIRAGPRTKMVTENGRFTSAQPEGIWTSLRNRLRLFRGVHKGHLSGYVAMFELAFNHDRVGPEVLRCMCGM